MPYLWGRTVAHLWGHTMAYLWGHAARRRYWLPGSEFVMKSFTSINDHNERLTATYDALLHEHFSSMSTFCVGRVDRTVARPVLIWQVRCAAQAARRGARGRRRGGARGAGRGRRDARRRDGSGPAGALAYASAPGRYWPVTGPLLTRY